MCGAPGHARDVRAADADIGEFAITEPAEFAQAGVVPAPFPDEADDRSKHDKFLFLQKSALGP